MLSRIKILLIMLLMFGQNFNDLSAIKNPHDKQPKENQVHLVLDTNMGEDEVNKDENELQLQEASNKKTAKNSGSKAKNIAIELSVAALGTVAVFGCALKFGLLDGLFQSEPITNDANLLNKVIHVSRTFNDLHYQSVLMRFNNNEPIPKPSFKIVICNNVTRNIIANSRSWASNNFVTLYVNYIEDTPQQNVPVDRLINDPNITYVFTLSQGTPQVNSITADLVKGTDQLAMTETIAKIYAGALYMAYTQKQKKVILHANPLKQHNIPYEVAINALCSDIFTKALEITGMQVYFLCDANDGLNELLFNAVSHIFSAKDCQVLKQDEINPEKE